MLHIDIKKLGRIERPSHRVTGDRTDRSPGAGWEFLFVAVDDHARIGFTAMHPDEKKGSAIAFLHAAVAYYAKLGITIRRLLTDNGSAFRSKAFVQACHELGIAKRYTRPYRPQTNGKAERFIQSALREWAYGFTYQHSAQRTAALDFWTHHYNWHRPHQGIGGSPAPPPSPSSLQHPLEPVLELFGRQLLAEALHHQRQRERAGHRELDERHPLPAHPPQHLLQPADVELLAAAPRSPPGQSSMLPCVVLAEHLVEQRRSTPAAGACSSAGRGSPG